MLAEADSREIASWLAYFKIEEELKTKKNTAGGDDLLKARLTAAGAAAGKKKSSKLIAQRSKVND